jgi:hypothetical protein
MLTLLVYGVLRRQPMRLVSHVSLSPRAEAACAPFQELLSHRL